MSAYCRLHPAVLFCTFSAVLLCTVFSAHPLVRGLSLLGALCLAAFERGILKTGLRCLPFCLLLTIVNPLFVHEGVTVLFWAFGAPFTLEALLYGAAQSVSLLAVLLWCAVYLRVLPEEKWLYLFGKRCPRLVLTLCMALRFVPLLRARLREADSAQTALGLQASATRSGRVRGKLRVLSAVLSLSLESAMDTALSMQARGYALRGRTRAAVFRFTVRDAVALALTGLLCAAVLALGTSGGHAYSFYPRAAALFPDAQSVWMCAAFGILALWPAAYEGWKLAVWKFCVSKT